MVVAARGSRQVDLRALRVHPGTLAPDSMCQVLGVGQEKVQ